MFSFTVIMMILIKSTKKCIVILLNKNIMLNGIIAELYTGKNRQCSKHAFKYFSEIKLIPKVLK